MPWYNLLRLLPGDIVYVVRHNIAIWLYLNSVVVVEDFALKTARADYKAVHVTGKTSVQFLNQCCRG